MIGHDMGTAKQAVADHATCGETDQDRPVDLVHLAKYTMGNRDLELEVLTLFTKQSLIYLERLRNAADQQTWKEAAHTLKGSARGIGAWGVADAVASIEHRSDEAMGPEKDVMIAELTVTVEDANAFIDGLICER